MSNPYEMREGFHVLTDTRSHEWCEAEFDAGRTTSRRWVVWDKIAATPQAKWVGPAPISAQIAPILGDAEEANTLPVFVSYAIPFRDAGGASSGGFRDVKSYQAWAKSFAQFIGESPAVVILEPDTLIHMPGLSTKQRRDRLACLTYAVQSFKHYAPNTYAYLDGGEGRYNSPASLAPWLAQAGIADARGFAVNVSNYNTTGVCQSFAVELCGILDLPDVGYVIDTSRNGNGPPPDSYIHANPTTWWGNPPGRKLGEKPQYTGGVNGFDATLWVKLPGESDGPYGVAPHSASSEFLPEVAYNLYYGR
ncbi:glycoside hydrolase family 6 protein [Allokutzneria oryzae]|uniref:Glucanase n=1 Tax=Allokutzneria oryzae TaxID=1378989 RepID=A0ABV6A7R2_9PSEU